MKFEFVYDRSLGLKVPVFHADFGEMTETDKAAFFEQAAGTTSRIPGELKKLDRTYMEIYEKIGEDEEKELGWFEELQLISEKISKLNALFYQIEGYFLQSAWHH